MKLTHLPATITKKEDNLCLMGPRYVLFVDFVGDTGCDMLKYSVDIYIYKSGQCIINP